MEVFITTLYSLVEHCQYGSLHDEMIRDRIVVGIRNSALSEKLQLDPTLTLQKAIQEARNSETVKQQQPFLRGKPDTTVGAVLTGSASRFARGSQNSVATHPHSASSRCTRCGRHPAHDQAQCPARDQVCRECKKRGHFQAVCRSTMKVRGIQTTVESQNAFLGAVTKKGDDCWTVTLKLEGKSEFEFKEGLTFKLVDYS